MIQEAGGIVSDLSGGDRFLDNGQILAANPKLHHAMLETITPHMTDQLRR
jgi:myo-inositol-1(or 4)-monophosphatase